MEGAPLASRTCVVPSFSSHAPVAMPRPPHSSPRSPRVQRPTSAPCCAPSSGRCRRAASPSSSWMHLPSGCVPAACAVWLAPRPCAAAVVALPLPPPALRPLPLPTCQHLTAATLAVSRWLTSRTFGRRPRAAATRRMWLSLLRATPRCAEHSALGRLRHGRLGQVQMKQGRLSKTAAARPAEVGLACLACKAARAPAASGPGPRQLPGPPLLAPPRTRPPAPQVCFERCSHGRSKEELYALSAAFEPAPGWCTLLTLGRLLGKAGSGADGAGGGGGSAGSSGIAEVEMEEDGGTDGGTPSGTPSSAAVANGSASGSGRGSEGGEESPRAAAKPGHSRWAAMDDSSEDEAAAAAAAARKKKKLGGGSGGGSGSGGMAVDDWRELLASGKQALAGKAPGSTPRGILSRGSGGSAGGGNGRSSAGKKRVRWPDEVGWCAALMGAWRFGSSGTGGKHGGLAMCHALHPFAGPPACPPCSSSDAHPLAAPFPNPASAGARGGGGGAGLPHRRRRRASQVGAGGAASAAACHKWLRLSLPAAFFQAIEPGCLSSSHCYSPALASAAAASAQSSHPSLCLLTAYPCSPTPAARWCMCCTGWAPPPSWRTAARASPPTPRSALPRRPRRSTAARLTCSNACC